MVINETKSTKLLTHLLFEVQYNWEYIYAEEGVYIVDCGYVPVETKDKCYNYNNIESWWTKSWVVYGSFPKITIEVL
jgi:hypothetical protein